MSVIEAHPLERRPDEPLKAHAALRRLADMGPGASLRSLQDEISGDKPAAGRRRARKSLNGQIGRWSVQYNWQARLDEHFRRLDALVRQEQEREIVEFRKRSARQLGDAARPLVQLCELAARKLDAVGDGDGADALMTAADRALVRHAIAAARALAIVLRGEGFARGDVSERIEHAAGGVGDDPVFDALKGNQEALELIATAYQLATADPAAGDSEDEGDKREP